MEPQNQYPGQCVFFPYGVGEYTLIICGSCSATTRHPYLGQEDPLFSCSCGHRHIYSRERPIATRSACTSCVAIHVCPTICCWSCQRRTDLSPSTTGRLDPDRPLQILPMYPYNGPECDDCGNRFDSSCVVQWEAMWWRPVGPWEEAELNGEEWEDEDEDIVEWKVFEIGVMDEESTGDLEVFRKEAVHRYRFAEPLGKDMWDMTRFDTGFSGWPYGPDIDSELWERSSRKGEVLVIHGGEDFTNHCSFHGELTVDGLLVEGEKGDKYLELGI